MRSRADPTSTYNDAISGRLHQNTRYRRDRFRRTHSQEFRFGDRSRRALARPWQPSASWGLGKLGEHPESPCVRIDDTARNIGGHGFVSHCSGLGVLEIDDLIPSAPMKSGRPPVRDPYNQVGPIGAYTPCRTGAITSLGDGQIITSQSPSLPSIVFVRRTSTMPRCDES